MRRMAKTPSRADHAKNDAIALAIQKSGKSWKGLSKAEQDKRIKAELSKITKKR